VTYGCFINCDKISNQRIIRRRACNLVFEIAKTLRLCCYVLDRYFEVLDTRL